MRERHRFQCRKIRRRGGFPLAMAGRALVFTCGVIFFGPQSIAAAGHRAIAYFDWDRYPEMREERFGFPSNEVVQRYWVHRQDLERAGLSLEDVCRSRRWYDLVFRQARETGFDTIAWETFGDGPQATPVRPNREAIAALRRHGLRVAPLLDWEIHHSPVALLSSEAYITPTASSAEDLVRLERLFAGFFPRDLWLVDRGRPVLFVFAYGFPKDDAASWDPFFRALREKLTALLGADPIVYISVSRAKALLHARLHESSWIRPFSFLAGGMQGPDCVTTSLWFDSRGAADRDGITRCVRTPRGMLGDLRSLLAHGDPAMIFHYGLNEMLEGADILPFNRRGRIMAKTLKELMGRTGSGERIEPVTILVDDLCHQGVTSPARAAWLAAEERFIWDRLPALFPYHDLVATIPVLPESQRAKLLDLRYSGKAVNAADLFRYAPIRKDGRPRHFRDEELIALLAKAWRMTPRETMLFGWPMAGEENAERIAPASPRLLLRHRATTFLPRAGGL